MADKERFLNDVGLAHVIGKTKELLDTKVDVDSGVVYASDDGAIEVDVLVEDVQSALLKKVDKVDGKTLTTNDFTDEYKTTVDQLESGEVRPEGAIYTDFDSSTEIAEVDYINANALEGHSASYFATVDDVNYIKSGSTTVGKATKDASGNVITSTYATKKELSTANSAIAAQAADIEDIVGGTTVVARATDSSKLGGETASAWDAKIDVKLESELAVDFAEAATPEFQENITTLNTKVDDLKSDLVKLGVFNPTWAQGYYANRDGKMEFYSGNARLSFAEGTVLTPEYPYEVTVGTGFKYWVHVLSAEDNSYISTVAKTEPYMLEVGYSYLITVAKADDSVIQTSENTCKIISKEYDTRISELEEQLIPADKNLFNLVSGAWIVAEPPYFGTGNTRLATPPSEYIEFESDFIITPYLGYSYLVLKYNKETKEYLGYDAWTSYSKTLSKDFAYRIDFRKNDNSVITLEDSHYIFYTIEVKPVFESRYFKGLHETRFYEKEDNLVSKVLADKTANTITFGVITDTHHAQYDNRRTAKQGKALARLCGRVGANFMIHLGDVIEGAEPTLAKNKFDLAEYWGEQNDTHIPILYTLAHHEQYGAKGAGGWGADATAITPSECIGMYGCTNKHLVVTYTDDKANWYADVDNIRFIGLDCTSNTNAGFSDEVISFVENALNGWNGKVVVFCHMPARASVNWGNGSTVQGDRIASILNGYSGEVLAYFHGHTHWDNIYKDASDKFPYIAICGAIPAKMDIATYGCESGNPTSYDRIIGDYSEYCFDIVNVHTDTGEIKMFRFGAGSDRTYTQS